jgi:hypothetical protein
MSYDIAPHEAEGLQALATLCHAAIREFGKRRGSLRQLEIFLHLAGHTGATRAEIASGTGLDDDAIYNDLERLGLASKFAPSAAGLVVAHKDTLDGVRLRYRLSAKGVAALEYCCQASVRPWGFGSVPPLPTLAKVSYPRLEAVTRSIRIGLYPIMSLSAGVAFAVAALNEGAILKTLAKIAEADYSGTSRNFASLGIHKAGLGLVSSAENMSNRRQYTHCLTPAGAALVASVGQAWTTAATA